MDLSEDFETLLGDADAADVFMLLDMQADSSHESPFANKAAAGGGSSTTPSTVTEMDSDSGDEADVHTGKRRRGRRPRVDNVCFLIYFCDVLKFFAFVTENRGREVGRKAEKKS